MARIDDKRLFGFTPNDGAIYFKGADGDHFDIHAGENRQGERGIKAGIEKMSPVYSQFYGFGG